jgi:hypothetical protein
MNQYKAVLVIQTTYVGLSDHVRGPSGDCIIRQPKADLLSRHLALQSYLALYVFWPTCIIYQ